MRKSKYTQEQIQSVIRLKDAKCTHRDIAELVFGRQSQSSSVGDILKKHHSAYNGLQPRCTDVTGTVTAPVASEYYGMGDSAVQTGEDDIYEETYPRGAAASPVNNLQDAMELASRVHKSTQTSTDAPPIRIMFIPDAQVKRGVPTNHLRALGNYIVDKKPDVIVNIGDFADMPSLSQYERAGSKATEGARYADDIRAARDAMDELLAPIREYNLLATIEGEEQYTPRMIMTLGNHEHRITRAIDDNPRHFEGVIGLEDLEYEEAGWEVYPFLEMVEVGGVYFSHYFVNPTSLTKNVIGGMMETKLKNLGFSFAMGHQQLLQHGILYRTNGDSVQGLVAGSFYQHNEGYMNIQGNRSHWRGAVMLNQVSNGNYDIMPLSLSYLLDKWDY